MYIEVLGERVDSERPHRVVLGLEHLLAEVDGPSQERLATRRLLGEGEHHLEERPVGV